MSDVAIKRRAIKRDPRGWVAREEGPRRRTRGGVARRRKQRENRSHHLPLPPSALCQEGRLETKLSLAARNSLARAPSKFRASGKYAEGATLEFNHYAGRPAARAALLPTLGTPHCSVSDVTHEFRTGGIFLRAFREPVTTPFSPFSPARVLSARFVPSDDAGERNDVARIENRPGIPGFSQRGRDRADRRVREKCSLLEVSRKVTPRPSAKERFDA